MIEIQAVWGPPYREISFHFSLYFCLQIQFISIQSLIVLLYSPKKLFYVFHHYLSPHSPSSLLLRDFVNYLKQKNIEDICSLFPHQPANTTCPISTSSSPVLTLYPPLPIRSLPPNHLPSRPSHHLQSIAPVLPPFLTHRINASLTTRYFHNTVKAARVKPLQRNQSVRCKELQTCHSFSFSFYNTLACCLHSTFCISPPEQPPWPPTI